MTIHRSSLLPVPVYRRRFFCSSYVIFFILFLNLFHNQHPMALSRKRTASARDADSRDESALRVMCDRLAPDEESVTSALLTLLANPGATTADLWHGSLMHMFAREDDVQLDIIAFDDGSAALAVDVAAACLKDTGHVGIRICAHEATPYPQWLHHSFVLARGRAGDDETVYMVDGCALRGSVLVRPANAWATRLAHLLRCAVPGPGRAAVWRDFVGCDAARMQDGAKLTGTRVRVVL